ncbi:GNAT family N-acetyltransferase [Desulfovibrio intestinalis]|uniref:GNAT superfamily N-acetyltransferase n=1 Tax=Desulfovibrio intestinalis TaxID=58621 RepID=A0A7W8C338_9BACT|nr:GNAT family N-acetyltransferase [Desulfovibrio intestinalis]MBB5144730.1 GNAT superfamily N-acetyltransferase [Desulfovibrio intestinalis]
MNKNDTVLIRPANTADVEAIFHIRTSVKENHLSREQMADMGITPEIIKETIAAGQCAWLAEVDGRPVAFAMIDVEEGCVFAAFVLPEFEGRGLGSKLMAEAEAGLFSAHESIWLETDGKSRAYRFYTRLGWNPVSTYENGDVRLEKKHPQAGK